MSADEEFLDEQDGRIAQKRLDEIRSGDARVVSVDAVIAEVEGNAESHGSAGEGCDDVLSADELREVDEAMRLVYRAGAPKGFTSVKQATIETERLRLVPLETEHADAVVVLFDDPAMSTYRGVDLSRDGLARTMVDNRLAFEGPPELGHWAMVREGEVVGLAHLRPSRELPGGLPEIGWYLGTPYGGVGLATEAARALLRHGLDELGLSSVWALVHVDNVPSLRVAERLGFLAVGEGFHYDGPHRIHVALPDRI